jgi:hypothetical protein
MPQVIKDIFGEKIRNNPPIFIRFNLIMIDRN